MIAIFVMLLILIGTISTANSGSITLTWEPGVGAAPDGYIVERRSGIAGYTEIARPTTPPYTDVTVPSLVPTCWQVRAYNAIGASLPSNSVCLDLPVAPVNLTITTGGPTAGQVRMNVQTKVRRKP